MISKVITGHEEFLTTPIKAAKKLYEYTSPTALLPKVENLTQAKTIEESIYTSPFAPIPEGVGETLKLVG